SVSRSSTRSSSSTVAPSTSIRRKASAPSSRSHCPSSQRPTCRMRDPRPRPRWRLPPEAESSGRYHSRLSSKIPMNTHSKIGRPLQERGSAPGRPAASQVRLMSTIARLRPKAPDAAAPTHSERPKVLFLDDEDRILNALAALFRYKYQVFTATTGEQALAILRQCHVHVVVSDQRMPLMTGVEFLRQAKEVSPHTVRILLTGFSDLSAIIDSVNDGEVYRFLNEPWGNQEIQAVIADALAIGLDLERVAANDPARPAPPPELSVAAPGDRPAVLMLHDKRETFDRIRPLLNDAHPFVYARTLDECLDALQREHVGVV